MEGENQSLLYCASFSCSPTCKPVLTNQAREACISACLHTLARMEILHVLLGDFYQHLSAVVNGLVGVHRKLTDTEKTLKQKNLLLANLACCCNYVLL